MKAIFNIYRQNIKTIFTNYAALIVILALCILPSLYAWFNIKACWDPYGQQATSGIKIGVVNLDTGTTLGGNTINIGNTVVEELKKNKQLGWQFVDEKTAREAIDNGRYYAMITIPENFSANLTSILFSNIQQGTIIYTVNEKINAIAPKITDKGATALQSMVSEFIVKTISEEVLRVANQLGIDLKEEIPNITKAQNLLLQIQDNFPKAEEFVDNTEVGIGKLKTVLTTANEDLPKVKEMIENSNNLGVDIKNFLGDTQAFGAEIAPTLKKDLTVIQGVTNEVATVGEGLVSAIEGGLENAPEMVSQLKNKVDSLSTMVEGLQSVLKTFNKLSSSGKLTQTVDKLTSVSESLSSMKALLGEIDNKLSSGEEIVDLSPIQGFVQASRSISDTIGTVLNVFESTIAPELSNVFNEANGVIDEVTGVLNNVEGELPNVSELLDVALTSADQGEKGMAFVKEILPQAKTLIDDLASKLALLNQDNGLEKLASALAIDIKSTSDFLSAPVKIQEERLYPMSNYGTAMTPFYTVLCLWVGVLLLMSILSVEAEGDYKPHEVYFGKFLLFGTITIVQAIIAALGDLYILRIYCRHPLLFMLGNIGVAITFTAIVYSLVSVFGNIGKVVAIILLVLQVAGSGGTYPVQLTPVFFQRINPFLPFTYGISFERETIGGIVLSVLWKDIGVLSLFTVVAIILALCLKKPVNRWLQGFFKAFEDSKLGES